MNRGVRFGFDGDDSSKWPDAFKGVSVGPTNFSYNMRGVEAGLVNYTEGGSKAGQFGLYNNATGSDSVQCGLWNNSECTKPFSYGEAKPFSYDKPNSLQIGVMNTAADRQRSFQIGAFNGAYEKSDAIQIGLVCFAGKEGNHLQLGLLTIRNSGPWYSRITPLIGWHRQRE